MDTSGIPFLEFIRVINGSAANSKISIGKFLMVAKSVYPRVNETE
jgi:hypothetical protein